MDHAASIPADASLTFHRAPAARQREALGLLLTGSASGGEEAVDQFLRFASEQGTPLRELWVAQRGGEAVAAALLVPAAGRTAMLFTSPPGEAEGGAAAELVRRLYAAQDPARLRIVQAILDPWQDAERAMLESAGFSRLATLIYMQRSTRRGPARLELEPGIDIAQWSERNRPLFERAILASYEGTLDCPGLLGLRTIDDILAGHMASGRFAPDLWFALAKGDEPVGVMLLSLVPSRGAAELVYLGMSPAWRGRGLGRRLLEFALSLARGKHATVMLLAVDDQNAPAVRLYESLGFSASARKTAMIRPLRRP